MQKGSEKTIKNFFKKKSKNIDYNHTRKLKMQKESEKKYFKKTAKHRDYNQLTATRKLKMQNQESEKQKRKKNSKKQRL